MSNRFDLLYPQSRTQFPEHKKSWHSKFSISNQQAILMITVWSWIISIFNIFVSVVFIRTITTKNAYTKIKFDKNMRICSWLLIYSCFVLCGTNLLPLFFLRKDVTAVNIATLLVSVAFLPLFLIIKKLNGKSLKFIQNVNWTFLFLSIVLLLAQSWSAISVYDKLTFDY